MAAEAIARAKVDVAGRGLNSTVIQDYYAIVVADRKFANSQGVFRKPSDFSTSRASRSSAARSHTPM